MNSQEDQPDLNNKSTMSTNQAADRSEESGDSADPSTLGFPAASTTGPQALSSSYGGPFGGCSVQNIPPHILSSLNTMILPQALSSSFTGPFGCVPNNFTSDDILSSLNGISGAQSLAMAADPFMSGATVVTNAVTTVSAASAPASSSAGMATGGGMSVASVAPPKVVNISKKSSNFNGKKDRRHSTPASIVLTPLQMQQRKVTSAPTHPVPEFLCHLYSMVNDPSLSSLIGWIVPVRDETTDHGGGRAGVGKIVILDPTRLQNEVLGKYYRHSNYSSFQRQLNYFGFKKRLHGSKKGKMCPCSFVHHELGPDPHSLLNLKRRPPACKRLSSEPNPNPKKSEDKLAKKKGSSKKDKTRGGIPSKVSFSSNGTNTTPTRDAMSDSSSNTIASRQNIPFIAQAPIGASFQQGLPLPGLWPASSIAAPNAAPNASSSNNDNEDKSDMSMMRANNNAAVLEARKSLEQNFLKNQQERVGETPRNNVVVRHPMMVMPNHSLPSVFAPGMTKVFDKTGKNWMEQVDLVMKSSPPTITDTAPSSSSYTTGPQAETFRGSFPSNAPFLVESSSGSSATSSTISNTPPNSLMAPYRNDAQMPNRGNFESHPQGMYASIYSDMLANLLSTALPPSEELFDDDMSAGNISDFEEGMMQVADDGMLLP